MSLNYFGHLLLSMLTYRASLLTAGLLLYISVTGTTASSLQTGKSVPQFQAKE